MLGRTIPRCRRYLARPTTPTYHLLLGDPSNHDEPRTHLPVWQRYGRRTLVHGRTSYLRAPEGRPELSNTLAIVVNARTRPRVANPLDGGTFNQYPAAWRTTNWTCTSSRTEPMDRASNAERCTRPSASTNDVRLASSWNEDQGVQRTDLQSAIREQGGGSSTGQGEVERPPAIQIRDLRPKYPEHISHTDQGTHHIQGR